ncbi:hypothetical protein J6590_075954 [Homalodisca vitripennis]|nr:hypothetical protein J6590_075954 [Homalodisca vitripennis]
MIQEGSLLSAVISILVITPSLQTIHVPLFQVQCISKKAPVVCSHLHPGHVDIVMTLLKSGADPLAKDAEGRTAADRALESQHNDVFELLKLQ